MIEETLAAILAELRIMNARAAAPGTSPAQTLGNPGAGQLGGPAPTLGQLGTAPAATNVTADQITALIQPHIGNETIKQALGAAMRGMGINALPEMQPHQFGDLYAAFQRVIAQHTGGGAQNPATSII